MINGLLKRAAGVTQLLVNDLDNPVPSQSDLHHAVKVLRIRSGEAVVVTDGVGGWRMCVWQDALVVDGPIEFEPRTSPVIKVGFALTKGDKPELVVQKLTEIGVDIIQPFVSQHTVVRWDDKKREANLERFRRVSHEAAMQSRRVWLPEVAEIAEFDHIAMSERNLAQAGGKALTLDLPEVFVGPEGGWSDAELATASAQLGLGPTILRAETAALAVAIQLVNLRNTAAGHLGSPS